MSPPTSRVVGLDSSSRVSVEQQLMADWAVRITGVHAETKNQWRLANSLRPVRCPQHSGAQP